MLPNFLIIGAPRSGTTHLYRGMRQHPEVFMSDFKEPMFFAFKGEKRPSVVDSLLDYQALFAQAERFNAAGEASTLYLYSPKAADNIHRLIPEAKLIAILRNPIDRAFSQYTFQRFLKAEPLDTFEDALDAEKTRQNTRVMPFMLYRQVGLYSEQIQRYQNLFDASQLHFILQDDLVRHADQVFHDIFAFIGVDATFLPELKHRTNASGVPTHKALFSVLKSGGRMIKRLLPEKVATAWSSTAHANLLARPEMRPETRRALQSYFRADIQKTADLLNRDLSHWLF